MKILYLVPGLDAPGGIQQFAKSQMHSLRNQISIDLMNLDGMSTRRKIILRLGPSYILARQYSSLIGRKPLGTPIPYDGYDLVHFWYIYGAINNPSSANSILTCYGNEILTNNVKGHRKYLFKKAFESVTLITACSQFTKNYLVSNYKIDPRKIIVIHPGIDLDLFKVSPKQNKKLTIGTIARLVTRKNIPNIIKALKILKSKHNIDFTYYLVGTGPEERRIKNELKDSGIDYKFLGKITDKYKVNVFYPSLDIFVLPSLRLKHDVEGFGIVYLEANACGVPVVAADTGGVSDAVRENVSGLFADPKDPGDIAKKVLDIANSKTDYRKSSRKWAEKFDQDKTATQFQALYNKINR